MATPLYPVTAPINGIDPNLFPFDVRARFFKQILLESPWSSIMGKEVDSPIVLETQVKGAGYEYRVPQLQQLNYKTPVLNFNQVRGQAQTQQVLYDKVDLQALSFPVLIKGEDLIGLGTPIRLPEQVNSQLVDTCRLALNDNLIDAVTVNNYAIATQKPSYDRSVFGTVYNPSRTTYNNLAGITTVLNSLTGVGVNQDGLSAAHLFNLKAVATLGGKNNGAVLSNQVTIENQIRPARLRSKGGWPINKYLYFTSQEAIRILFTDTQFNQSTINRGAISDPENQPEAISGSTYVGEFNGIEIYQVNELSRYTVVSQDGTKRAAWGFLIGAAAWSLGWYRHPWFAYHLDTIDQQEIWTSHETRGQKCLRFASKQASTVTAGNATVEQGIVHSFTQIPL